MKLLALGDKLFKPGLLKSGDLVLHPRVFNETKRWPQYKKEKYKTELSLLGGIKATPGLKPGSRAESENLEAIIVATMDTLGTPIGAADREQLASAIHCAAEIVTNDSPFAGVAEALNVEVHTAESIVAEACSQGVVTKNEVKAARAKWETNGEKKASASDKAALDAVCR